MRQESQKYKTIMPTMMMFLIFGIDLFASLPYISVSIVKTITLSVILFLFFKILFSQNSYKRVSPSIGFSLVYFFLLLLTIRLINDFIIEGHTLFIYKSNITLFSIYTILIICPSICFGKRAFPLNIPLFALSLQLLCFVALLFSVKSIYQGNIDISSDGRFSGEGVLDIIYLGHQGVTLIILSLYNFRFRKLIMLNIICIAIGLLAVIFSASRGPIVALAACIIVYFSFYIKSTKTKILLFSSVAILYFFYETIIIGINNSLEQLDIHTFSRIADFLFGDSSTSGRDSIFEEGWKLFTENPILGYGYLMPDESYVHNIFIEQFMATGIVGGVIFITIVLFALNKGYKYVKHHEEAMILYVLLVQYLMFGFFSRTLIALPQLLICIYAVLHLMDHRYNRIVLLKQS